MYIFAFACVCTHAAFSSGAETSFLKTLNKLKLILDPEIKFLLVKYTKYLIIKVSFFPLAFV